MTIACAGPMPVTVLTGFLGSGKTTVLNHILHAPGFADTAVIVNEFGEVGIDHLVIEQAVDDAVLLANGCVCCTIRGDIADTLEELLRRRHDRSLPPFTRVIIETTGLADPAPIADVLGLDAQERWRLDGVVATFDALLAPGLIERQPEIARQVSFADRVLVTKTDLVAPGVAEEAERQSRSLNPAAVTRRAVRGVVAPEELFGIAPTAERPYAERWLGGRHRHDEACRHVPGFRHDPAIRAVTLRLGSPLPAAALGLWLRSLLSLRGADLLRLKGVVQISDRTDAVLIQAVQDVLHPVTSLGLRSAATSEIVIIGRGLSGVGLERSLRAAIEALSGS